MKMRIGLPDFGSEGALISALRKQDSNAIRSLYKSHFPMVQNFIRTNGGSEQEAKDIFQEGILVFFNKINDESFVLECKIKTFLYSVCRRLWLTELKKKKNRTAGDIEDMEGFLIFEENDLSEITEKEQQLKKLVLCLDKIGDPCSSLLRGFYLQDLSMQEITEMMGYNNADTTKNLKYKCLMRLKKIFFAPENSRLEEVGHE